MSIYQRDSLRFVRRPCGRQVGMTDRAGYRQHSSGMRSHVIGWSGVYGKEKRSQYWTLGDPCGEVVSCRSVTKPGYFEWPTSEVWFKPGVCSPCDAHAREYGKRMPWLTVSNVADKPSRISTEDLAVTLASFKASVKANRTVSVKWPF